MAIINSILDTDLYKLTTSYAYTRLFPRACGEFEFIDRNNTIYPDNFDVKVKEEIDAMARIRLTISEENFLRENLPYLPPSYIDLLKGLSFDPSEVSVSMKDGRLRICASGFLYRISLWETPILAIVSELYFKEKGEYPDLEHIYNVTKNKAEMMRDNDITFSLFGMRRRFSYEVEDKVTSILKEYSNNNFFGTSNIHFAHKHNLKVSGTHPHEWFQFHGAIFGYTMANYMGMENWISVYDGNLGTVLTDTYTTDVFFSNFSKKHALLFTSLRQDSGDPFIFTEKALKRYYELKVNPKTKYIVFSDALDIPKAIEIRKYVDNRIGCTFGIGTNLTNDVGNGVKPMNIVMKLHKCKMTPKENWKGCIKISDATGKYSGNKKDIELAMMTLGISN